MKWSIVLKKLLTGFVVGGAASVGQSIQAGQASADQSQVAQYALVGAIVGVVNAAANWYKHRKAA